MTGKHIYNINRRWNLMFKIRNSKKSGTNTVKLITVYVSEKYKQLIITRNQVNSHGIISEQKECFATDYPMNSTQLGTEIISSLNLFSINGGDFSSQNLSDWPAYTYSKCKSVSCFKKEYITIFIRGVNENNLVLIMEGCPSSDIGLTVNSSISFYADKDEIGKRFEQVYQAALTGRLF